MRWPSEPQKQWTLTESETITTFYNWQSNLQYHLSTTAEFVPFLELEWQPKSVANRGLQPDGANVAEAQRKTAAQKNIILERILGLIAQFVPPLLRNDVIKKSTSLAWIWTRVRKYYSFTQSEVNFLKLHTIKREDGERYEALFQRIIAHLEDNLLTVASGIHHDGAAVAADEVMSPTTERLATYLWLQLIDRRLPAFVMRIYAHDLQAKSLKDLQPQLAENMDSLLTDLCTQEEVHIQYSQSTQQRRAAQQRFRPTQRQKSTRPRSNTQQMTTPRAAKPASLICIICKSAGRPFNGHDVGTCWFVSKFDKMSMSKALCVVVEDDTDAPYELLEEAEEQDNTVLSCQVKRVQCNASPFFYAFHMSTPCHVTIDSGATSSLISRAFAVLANIQLKPTLHSAKGVNKTPINVLGEVHFVLHFDGIDYPMSALIVDNLDSDILAGTPFCKQHDVTLFLGQEKFALGQREYAYGARSDPPPNEIYQAQSIVLRNPINQVVLPGEYAEFHSDDLDPYDGEVAVEPRFDSPNNGSWPEPNITRVIAGSIRIPNNTSEPVHLKRQQHFAQIRRVTDLPLSPPYVSGGGPL